MAVVLRSTKGSALTHAELDGNFSDYSTFKALFDTTEFSGSNNGQFLFWNNSNSKVEVKSLESSDITDAITSQFNSLLATKTTAHLTEGANKYYTDARVDARIGAIDTNALAEGSNNLYFTNARVDQRLNAILPTKTTDNISEGSKLYYTDGRVDARFNTRRLTHLAGVDGVDATTDGKVLYYDHSATTFKWKTDAAAGNLTNLSDVDTVSLSDNDKFLYYNHGTTSFKWKAVASNTDSLIEGSTNLYYTDARFDSRLASKTTANLTEGSNLYFTNERVDDRVANLIVAGSNITKVYDDASGTLTINSTASGSDQNLFSTIAVSGQSNIVADSTTDTLTLVAGSNVTITTNAGTDTVTIAAAGGGGGTPGGANTQVQYNNSGAFGAEADFTYNSTTNTLTVPNIVVTNLTATSVSPPSGSNSYTITAGANIILDPAGEVQADAPFKLKQKTVAELQGGFTASAGSMVSVSNNGYKPAYYDGSNWKYVATDSNV